jgi:hypothetical protein
MKRLVWLGIGIAVGVVAVKQLTRASQAYAPAGLADTARNSAAGLLGSVRDFVSDLREGMTERESEIHSAFRRGVSLDGMDDLDNLEDLDDFEDLDARDALHGGEALHDSGDLKDGDDVSGGHGGHQHSSGKGAGARR